MFCTMNGMPKIMLINPSKMSRYASTSGLQKNQDFRLYKEYLQVKAKYGGCICNTMNELGGLKVV